MRRGAGEAALVKLLWLLLALAGCAGLDRYETRVEAMNRSLDRARNDMLLLNALRAGQSHPMTFMAITNVSGEQGVGAALGLPSVTLGPNMVLSQLGLGGNDVAARASGSIAGVPLETREFYQGLLQPISLQAAQFLLHQGYPRAVLFLVLIESLRLRSAGQETILWNDPSEPAYGRFEDYLRWAVDSGLALEAMPDGRVRACFDRGRARAPLGALGPVCGSGGPDGLRGLVDREIGPVAVEVTLRSTLGVFRYLGKLADPALGDRVRLTGLRSGGLVIGDDSRLFPLQRGPPGPGCIATARFLEESYCLPARGAEQGPLMLQLLAQLVGLNVSVRDLPAVPTVRLTN